MSTITETPATDGYLTTAADWAPLLAAALDAVFNDTSCGFALKTLKAYREWELSSAR